VAQSELANIDLARLWVRSRLTNRTRLADDPCPAGSFSWGSPDLRRLRIGRYRVLYEITDEAVAVRHIARGTTS
jgi:mRNA-degrading endonuclease RelE of RelBE toxin-antitoxin system